MLADSNTIVPRSFALEEAPSDTGTIETQLAVPAGLTKHGLVCCRGKSRVCTRD